MAKLKLAPSAFIFFFLSISYALTSSEGTDIAKDDLIALPSASSSDSQQTILPTSNSKESSSVPVNADPIIAVDLTELKEETDDIPGSNHHHHLLGRSERKEILYGNDMILSSRENFEKPGFVDDKDFGGDGGLRKFDHHHRHHHGDDDDEKEEKEEREEVEGVEKEKEGHPHGHWLHLRIFGGGEKHPFHHKSHHCRHHHDDDDDSDSDSDDDSDDDDDDDDEDEEEEKREEVKGVEEERGGPPLGHWLYRRKFGGGKKHPIHHKSDHHKHHHHHHGDDDGKDEEEEREKGGLLSKLKKFMDVF